MTGKLFQFWGYFIIFNKALIYCYKNTSNKISSISILKKIHSVGADIKHSDRWTEGHDVATGLFSRLCKRP